MHFIYSLIIGFLVGLIAKFLMPGRDPGGFIITILLGIAGSFLATWLGQLLHFYHPGDKAGFIASIIGAIIILFLYRKFFSSPGEIS
ncbi:GlsB/YeaQ/YmgE family stress response membrane protein [Entomobacter blattae]|uniref:Transglycosylase associated protein n=1 Tax=Entomobacter blattae TaxID=2762277 RepID=A0A7H1NSU8_9PROT|nr:GlsB/YeaQ/YmgE family stress response membrane protein [Entomobacter blattae]QNT78858.1 Transglycosylase associated protein [Entomobacter blattae]